MINLHERNEVDAARRAYDGINHVITDQSLLRKNWNLVSPSRAMPVTRKPYVPSDEFDKHTYTRECINIEMTEGEQLALYVERICIILEKLPEVGIIKTERDTRYQLTQATMPFVGP